MSAINISRTHVVSDQVRDQMQAAYGVAKATVDAMQANINAAKAAIASNEANVRSLNALQGFQKVFSPFAGVITARNVEVGSLINPGSSSVSSSTGTTASTRCYPEAGALKPQMHRRQVVGFSRLLSRYASYIHKCSANICQHN
jgi:multidrug efflux pump subunit AcrA (membrane-fusion protein)